MGVGTRKGESTPEPDAHAKKRSSEDSRFIRFATLRLYQCGTLTTQYPRATMLRGDEYPL